MEETQECSQVGLWSARLVDVSHEVLRWVWHRKGKIFRFGEVLQRELGSKVLERLDG